MSFREVQAARRQARAATERRYQLRLRAPNASFDPDLSEVTVKTRLVRHAAAVIDADPGLVAWVTDKIAAGYQRPGRPRELSVRTALICFVVHTMLYKHFHLVHLPRALEGMTWRVRRQLGIAYIRNGAASQLTYNQFLDLFHDLANVFDAWGDDLGPLDNEPELRAARAADLQEFADRMIVASNHAAPMWSGNGAFDATMKWSHERPFDSTLNSKIARRGVDGDGGAPQPLSKIVGDEDGEIDRTMFGSSEPSDALKASAGRVKRPSSWPSTWSLGSAWVGRANVRKVVHGYAMHSLVRSGGPLLVEGFSVTPAHGDPVKAGMPLLRRVYDRRSQDPAVLNAASAGEVFILGDIAADAAYTTTEWMLNVKAMNATPIARLHATNQQGLRFHKIGKGKRAGEIATFGGRPVCECLGHTPLAALRFPKFPFTSTELDAYQAELAKTVPFEWSPNGAARPDGSRQYIAPHDGGCEHCVDATGKPRIGPDGRKRRPCCTVRTRLVPREVIALEQGVRAGGPEWEEKWNLRNRVEGSYGILKNISVIGYCRAYHRFVGLARETLVTVFALVAYNFHMLRQWQTRQRYGIPDVDKAFDPFGNLPSDQPTATAPPVAAPAPVKPTGPRGLEFLGAGRAGPGGPPPAKPS